MEKSFWELLCDLFNTIGKILAKIFGVVLCILMFPFLLVGTFVGSILMGAFEGLVGIFLAPFVRNDDLEDKPEDYDPKVIRKKLGLDP